MGQKICCVTGHRVIPKDSQEFVRQQLTKEIRMAVQQGYTTFLSGFAQGADLLFAECVVTVKLKNPLVHLIAAIPYRNRLHTGDELF